MGRNHLIGCAGLLVALIMLAGCGGETLGTGPQGGTATYARAITGAQTKSTSLGDLLYITTTNYVDVLTYPQLRPVMKLPADYGYESICSDPHNGNVFVVDSASITVYAHGGSSPIATLTASPYAAFMGCSVDPSTGNLATAALGGFSNPGAVIIFPGAQGSGTAYVDNKLREYENVAYDNDGNLFLRAGTKDGQNGLFELPAGKQEFTRINYVGNANFFAKMQWDGSYLVYDEPQPPISSLERIQITGHHAKNIGAITLLRSGGLGTFWIYNGAIVTQFSGELKGSRTAVAVWKYPKGGEPTHKRYDITKGRGPYIRDFTISVAPQAPSK